MLPGTFSRMRKCSGQNTYASGYVPGGTYLLADLFPQNIFAPDQIRYDTVPVADG